MSCKQTTNTPINQEEDPCGGTHKSTECVTEPNALTNLGLSADSTQSEINLAIQTALYTLSIADYRAIGYTVATLPSSPNTGTLAHVTDADTPVYRSPVSAGGSEIVLVFFDGTNWICH